MRFTFARRHPADEQEHGKVEQSEMAQVVEKLTKLLGPSLPNGQTLTWHRPTAETWRGASLVVEGGKMHLNLKYFDPLTQSFYNTLATGKTATELFDKVEADARRIAADLRKRVEACDVTITNLHSVSFV